MTILPYELESVVLDMHRASDAKLYYPCLLVALTLPEICSGLLLPKDKFVKSHHYIHFVNTYSSPSELGLDGESCYRIRGGLVHRGDMRGHAHFDATHVVFVTPESRTSIHAMSIASGEKLAFMLSLESFINAMDAAVRRWFVANKAEPQMSSNLPHLIRYSSNGVMPFTEGHPAVVSGE